LGVLKLGDIFIDGSKVEVNASKHKTISWEYANKLEAHLKAEVERLLEMAETTHDQGNRGLDIPAEIGDCLANGQKTTLSIPANGSFSFARLSERARAV
jgi:hypothetical protein